MLNIVYNPTAAKGKAERALKKVKLKLQALNMEYKIYKSQYARHAIEITKAIIESGENNVVAMGGDGTISEVLNGFSNFENVTLGIIPCGSGNDFVRSAKIPLSTDKALDLIISAQSKYTDFMQMDGVRGINVIGTGIDVDVLQRCIRGKLFKGKVQYLLSLIVSLFKFKNYNLKVKYNDKVEDRNALIACVCNGKVFGGGIKVCPIAEIDDSFMNYLIAFDVKKRAIPYAFYKLMGGKILDLDIAYTEKTRSIEITSPQKLIVNVDGELYENLDFKIDLISNTLKIYR